MHLIKLRVSRLVSLGVREAEAWARQLAVVNSCHEKLVVD